MQFTVQVRNHNMYIRLKNSMKARAHPGEKNVSQKILCVIFIQTYNTKNLPSLCIKVLIVVPSLTLLSY